MRRKLQRLNEEIRDCMSEDEVVVKFIYLTVDRRTTERKIRSAYRANRFAQLLEKIDPQLFYQYQER